MPPGATVDLVSGRPPGPLTVENDIMYIKVRSSPLPGWGSAGLQVLNISSGTWLGTAWSPLEPAAGSSHYPTPTVTLRVLESDGPRNRHAAFFTARASNGTYFLHAALFGTTQPVTSGAPVNGTAPGVVLGYSWVTALAGQYQGDMLSDPALFDSLNPGSGLAPDTLGFLVATSLRSIHVVNASTGALLYTHTFPDRVLRPQSGTFAVPPVNFRGLAVVPTANNSVIAYDLAARAVAWEAPLPHSFIASMQPSKEVLVVRLVSSATLPNPDPYFTISPDGAVRSYNPDPDTGFSTPRVSNPLAPVTPAGQQFLLVSPAPQSGRPRLATVDLKSRQTRTVDLGFNMRVAPLPPAITYDSCRVVVYGTNDVTYDNSSVAVTAAYVVDVASGALIWSRELMAADEGEDPYHIAHPHVDPVSGSIYLLREQTLFSAASTLAAFPASDTLAAAAAVAAFTAFTAVAAAAPTAAAPQAASSAANAAPSAARLAQLPGGAHPAGP
ncbi:hypothetical protein GPECTOR_1g239 [Gonium pectorale]|uniref:Pyrrolo-quinoline quinone repeat domain-containing protein n=1 Tax=Gonium pectorale TaxID=33097 RepID=A0A150H2P7_GONPE|nr:hypothetical protein GPECTOR_1g239 [Gonium pectorale]|eukprot:KXZ56273.1 hypothetical protein GPECTOR_1g239 [Gonium pectorale]